MLTQEQSLMLAVLEQAVNDLQSPTYAVSRKARAWFFASKQRANHVFAFQRICQELGCDPAAVRLRIFRKCNGNGGAADEAQHEKDTDRESVD